MYDEHEAALYALIISLQEHNVEMYLYMNRTEELNGFIKTGPENKSRSVYQLS